MKGTKMGKNSSKGERIVAPTTTNSPSSVAKTKRSSGSGSGGDGNHSEDTFTIDLMNVTANGLNGVENGDGVSLIRGTDQITVHRKAGRTIGEVRPKDRNRVASSGKTHGVVESFDVSTLTCEIRL